MKPDDPAILLRKSRDDLAAMVLFDEQRFGTDEQYGFWCQQTIEKAIKSVLGARGVHYPWSHDLTRLRLLLEQAGIGYPPELREADLYTPFAVRFRYEALDDQDATAAPFDRAHARSIASLAVEWAGGFARENGGET